MLGRLPASARSFLQSTLLISISNAVLKASNAVLFVLVVHAFGKDLAGQYSTATTLVALALGLAQFGLDEILIRETPRRQDVIGLFANFLLVRVGLTLLAILLLDAGLLLLRPYPVTEIQVVALLSLSALGDAVLQLCQALFIAHDRPGLVMVTSSATSAARILLALVAIRLWPESLGSIVLMFVLTSLGGAALALGLGRRAVFGRSVRAMLSLWKFGEARKWVVRSGTFFWINLFVLIEFQADIILLSVLRKPGDVALYNAALTVMLAAWILPVAFRTVTYPRLARALARSRNSFWRFLRQSSVLGLVAGFASAGTAYLLAPVIIGALYPRDYGASVQLLKWLTLPLLFAFVSAPASRALLTLNREKLAMQLVAISAGVNVGINCLLIPRLGPTGAAIARASSAGLFMMLCYVSLAAIRRSQRHIPAAEEA